MTEARGNRSDDTRYRYRQGLGHSAAYQVSGHPFITGSTSVNNNSQIQVVFPMVARKVTVTNRADVDLLVYFTDANSHKSANNGASGFDENVLDGRHYVTLPTTGDKVTFEVKCKEIFIGNKTGDNGAFELHAELTSIHPEEMYALSGSGLTDVDTANNFRTTTI
jgi:hypothetical protein